MQRTIVVQTQATTGRLYDVIADLGTYPSWLDVVAGADPESSDATDAPVWLVTLRARVGPFARSKRLRVERTDTDGETFARFERRELDGRDHADWVMHATVEDVKGVTSELRLDLSYSGGLWSGPLDAVLGNEIDTAVARLPAYIDGLSTPEWRESHD